jgi:hypothetical protein
MLTELEKKQANTVNILIRNQKILKRDRAEEYINRNKKQARINSRPDNNTGLNNNGNHQSE